MLWPLWPFLVFEQNIFAPGRARALATVMPLSLSASRTRLPRSIIISLFLVSSQLEFPAERRMGYFCNPAVPLATGATPQPSRGWINVQGGVTQRSREPRFWNGGPAEDDTATQLWEPAFLISKPKLFS